jgi:hypothetical protein
MTGPTPAQDIVEGFLQYKRFCILQAKKQLFLPDLRRASSEKPSARRLASAPAAPVQNAGNDFYT